MDDYTVCRFCRVHRYNPVRGFDRCYWCNLIRRNGLSLTLSDYLEEGEADGTPRHGGRMVQAYGRMVHAGGIDASDPEMFALELDSALVDISSHQAERQAYGEPATSTFVLRQGPSTFMALSDSVDGLLYQVDLETYADGGFEYRCECPAGSNQRHCKRVDRTIDLVAIEATEARVQSNRTEPVAPVDPARLQPPQGLWAKLVKFFWG